MIQLKVPYVSYLLESAPYSAIIRPLLLITARDEDFAISENTSIYRPNFDRMYIGEK